MVLLIPIFRLCDFTKFELYLAGIGIQIYRDITKKINLNNITYSDSEVFLGEKVRDMYPGKCVTPMKYII